MPPPALLLLTAARGAGKTTAACRAVRLAAQTGLRVGGILAPPRCDAAGARLGIDAVDLASGQRRSLADLEPDPARATVGRYRFDPAALAWSTTTMLAALSQPLDLVVIDEIGRLELRQGGGYAPVLRALPTAAAANVLILVRDAFLEELAPHLTGFPQTAVRLTPETRDAVPEEIMRLLRPPRCA